MATMNELQAILSGAKQRFAALNPPTNEFALRKALQSDPALQEAMNEVQSAQQAFDAEYSKAGPGQMPFRGRRMQGALSIAPGALNPTAAPVASSPAASVAPTVSPALSPALLAQANRQDEVANMDASSAANPSPMVQAMINQSQPQTSYDAPDTAQALAQAQIDPTRIAPGPDPFANTYNKAATAYQGALKSAQDDKSGYGWADALIDAGRGLMIAGSPDPAKAAASFADAWANERAGRKNKVTPLADGAFSMVTKPDGTYEIVRNDQIANYIGDRDVAKFQQALQKVILGGRVQAEVAADKAAVKTAEEARPLLNDVNSLINRWNEASNIVQKQGASAQIQGAFPTIAGFFGGDQVAANKFLQGLTVDETLLNTAKTKGAISNTEMMLFKSPIPSLTDDREKVWKPWIEKRVEVLNKLKTFYEGEVARGAAAGAPATTPAAPNASPAPAPAAASGSMSVPGLSPNASQYFNR